MRRMYYRAIQKNWLRQRIVPENSARICGCQIPQESVTLAAIGMTLAIGLRFLDDRRYQMAGIPELSHPAIVETIQDTRTRCTPIGREDRLPDREHHHRLVGVRLQNLLDCGGPPQTCRSSGREQQNYPQHA